MQANLSLGQNERSITATCCRRCMRHFQVCLPAKGNQGQLSSRIGASFVVPLITMHAASRCALCGRPTFQAAAWGVLCGRLGRRRRRRILQGRPALQVDGDAHLAVQGGFAAAILLFLLNPPNPLRLPLFLLHACMFDELRWHRSRDTVSSDGKA